MVYFPTCKEAEAIYAAVCGACKGRLRVPRLRLRKGGGFTVQGLTLTLFAYHLGDVLTKVDVIRYLKRMRVSSVDPQPRHLGMQHGFDFLVAGCYHPRAKRVLKRGQYCLFSVGQFQSRAAMLRHNRRPPPLERRPAGPPHRARPLTRSQFESIKTRYGMRCGCCGSQEGVPHLKNPRLITALEMAHMDPRESLRADNAIPMCSMCNKVYRNRAVFNARGYIRAWLHER